ncbi:uncharacterized protein [Aristolochia californica]|uniref:uncharacterized protein n=1 Tax=Aristolochia californica TaxID=171875 RepID=UPI0035D9855F
MGCFPIPWRSSSSFDWVRVVHVSGFVEDFNEPVTVRDVVGDAEPPIFFLCSTAHLLSFGTQPLRPEDVLQRGRFYFLIPHSIFQTDSSSPTDLVHLAARLSAIAKRSRRLSAKSTLPGGLFQPSAKRIQPVAASGSSTFEVRNRGRLSCRVGSWKPILETIEEKAFERR